MEKLFYPDSIVIMGLSDKENNLSRLILGNLLRWGYSGRLFGVNARISERHVDGIRMYEKLSDLPVCPDLAVALVPARFIPEVIKQCGKCGIKRMAIPSGGFNEAGTDGARLADEALQYARKYNIRFIGPNGLTVVNTANGLCLPFLPLYPPAKGGMSVITQSGGLGLFLWNLMADESIGLAKFASIGNKLDLTEVDFIRYFAKDPETEIICLYAESITDGKGVLDAVTECEKPVVFYKANTTDAGARTAMSHTAALGNDDDIVDTAFERAGIIRINRVSEFISVTKAFSLPPMRGNRIMAMSPAGGFSVIMADLCDKEGFEFADPGKEFYEEIAEYGNAGIINVSNPLDMGDMYDPRSTADIFHSVLHNENVDGAVFINQWPRMPRGDDIFSRMFHTDLSQESMGAIRSSGKPLGICLFGPSSTITRIKKNLSIPIFNTPEEMIRTLKIQQEFYARQEKPTLVFERPEGLDQEGASLWLKEHDGVCGEESLELLNFYGIQSPRSLVVADAEQAVEAANKIEFPVVLKVVSPDAVHKSDVGGVLVGLSDDEAVRNGFGQIQSLLNQHIPDADFQGVRVMGMAQAGIDMFVGGKVDESFGPVVFFGYGGIYVEVFNDVERALCPTTATEVQEKLAKLQSYAILTGARGAPAVDIQGFAELIVRVSALLADFPEIAEIDLNPVRVFHDSQPLVLDCRLRIVS